MADRQSKAMRIVVGIMLMVAFVFIIFGLVARYAGSWGVPYFSYTSERGSTCKNTLTGYVCEPLTLADLEFYSDLDLPGDTRVISATYTATHDYTLAADLRLTPRSQAAGFKALQEQLGGCRSDRPSTISTSGLSNFCVLANDNAGTRAGEPPSRLYVVATGVAKNGVRVVNLSIRSR